MKDMQDEKERMPKMGNSEQIDNNIGQTVVGIHNKYRILSRIGSGGNGTVYDVQVVGASHNIPFSKEGYFIKLFTASSDRSKRIKRFAREIETVMKLHDKVNGIIPIYDYSPNNKDIYWLLGLSICLILHHFW